MCHLASFDHKPRRSLQFNVYKKKFRVVELDRVSEDHGQAGKCWENDYFVTSGVMTRSRKSWRRRFAEFDNSDTQIEIDDDSWFSGFLDT